MPEEFKKKPFLTSETSDPFARLHREIEEANRGEADKPTGGEQSCASGLEADPDIYFKVYAKPEDFNMPTQADVDALQAYFVQQKEETLAFMRDQLAKTEALASLHPDYHTHYCQYCHTMAENKRQYEAGIRNIERMT